MERLLQYLDDVDDVIGMAGLVIERLRRLTYTFVIWLLTAAGAVFSVWLALRHPPVALATATVLFVLLLYRSVTTPSARWSQAT